MRARRAIGTASGMLLAGGVCLALAAGAFALGRVSEPGGERAAAGTDAAGNAPFRTGEKLFFQIGWMNLTDAATAELKVAGRQNFYGDPAWHFQAIAHSEGALRYLMVLDDQFDSYADQATFATRQYELYLHEQGKQATKKLALNGWRPGTTRVTAAPGTLDPLAALYKLRTIDWDRTGVLHAPVYDGTHFYQMTAQRAAEHDRVTVVAGTFDATRIVIHVISRESGSSMDFTLWLANNGARTPVEVDADVPVGTVKGQLTRVE